MRKAFLLFFAILTTTVGFCIQPYPETGSLFNTESTACAIGRPLDEVLSELLGNSNFFGSETDCVSISTSMNKHKLSTSKGGVELPALLAEDTLLFVDKHSIKGKGEGGLNDTCFIFGIYFSPADEDALRRVKLLRVSYFTVYESIPLTPFIVDWSQHYFQSAEVFLGYLSPDYFYNKLDNDCPKPNETHTVEDEDHSEMAKTDGKTVLYRNTSKISASTSTHQVKYYLTDYVVGQINYCPVEVELNEEICQGESYTFGDHELGTTTDDTLTTKTWYGADSTTILHLTVHNTANITIDTTIYSGQSLEIDGKTITRSGNYTEKEQTVFGCDSVVTYQVTVLANDTTYYPIKPGTVVTPNGDGTNDTWQIVNIDRYNIYTIRIYSRSGKELALYKNHYDGWDGTYKGKKLPSADYWYAISLDESDETVQGHFTLTWE